MTAGRTCWLHEVGAEHPVDLLVGVRREQDVVIPADLRCARTVDDQDVVPATEINVELVRS